MQVAESTVQQIRDRLARAREQADVVLARAAAEAREIEGGADAELRERVEERIGKIEALRSAIDEQSRAVEGAYVRMVECMAATSMQLLAAAREADFSAPAWPGGIPRAVELKLSETREVSVRVPLRDARRNVEG